MMEVNWIIKILDLIVENKPNQDQFIYHSRHVGLQKIYITQQIPGAKKPTEGLDYNQ